MNSSRTYNGRVNLADAMLPTFEPAKQFKEPNQEVRTQYARQEAVGYMFQANVLQELFFGRENIETLQKLLQYHVLQQSGGRFKIGRQDDFQLRAIMKSVYLSDGKNLPHHLQEQVRDLNRLVIEYAVPTILSNIQQHEMYLNDISKMPVPMELPQYTSSAGTRTNPNVNIF